MRSIKAGSVLAGMQLIMLTWVKPGDRRGEPVLVKSVSGKKDTLVMQLVFENGEGIEARYEDGCVRSKFGGDMVRVTFQIEDSANILFSAEPGKQYNLADKNNEVALWKCVDKNTWQLPDDACCGSTHSASELVAEGYTVSHAA